MLSWTTIWIAVGTIFVAAVVMNFSRPEKRLEKKVAHRYASTDPQFIREMSVLLGPSILEGNLVTVLNNGREIFPAMFNAICGAKVSVCFETYIYWLGEVGRQMADSLAAKAREGVPVHVLIDWMGSLKMDDELLQTVQSAGVEVHRYRPLHWYNLGRMNNRTHRKLLIVDGCIAFTGGVGIADQWNGNAATPEEWRDLHFKAEGPVALHFQAAFNDNWIKTTGTVLNGADYFPEVEAKGTSSAQLFLSSPVGGSESMHLMYLMAIAASSHTLDLQASYFVPDRLIIKVLLDAIQRGVRIRITLPGKHIDSEAVRLASKAQWGELLQAGAEIYEYQPTMIHSKLLIVDHFLVSVGSTNFDVRSFRLNDEASLNVYDPLFAKKMVQVFERDLKDCIRYSYEHWKNRSLGERIKEKLVLPIRSQL